MKQKITISAIIRRSIVVICAVFCFAIFFAWSDNSTSTLPTLSDIFAYDVSVEYDGRPHSISIANTLPTDTVTYSTNNIVYSASSPSFTDVGSYTVYFKVSRSGYAEFSSSANVSIAPTILPDISASDISVVYDGLPHFIAVNGTMHSDVITYSTDGFSFSSDAPTFTGVGTYTVYYRVERSYGEYKSSCTVTILPNIYGRYFNPDYGVIVITKDIPFSVSGTGYIDDKPFSVTDKTLTYNSIEYSLLSNEDYVYRLSASDKSVYFCSLSSGYLSISFNDNTAEIRLAENTLLSVPNSNYCESGVISDYTNFSFTQAFSSSGDVTDIFVELSVRAVNPISVNTKYYTYDGLPHGFDFSDDVIFLDEINSFTEVGSYTVSVICTSSVYLPKVLDCTLVILPNVSGVFWSSAHVIEIVDENISIDGKPVGKLSINGDTWTFNGLPITVINGGIEYAGAAYSLVSSPILAIYVDDVYCSCILVSADVSSISISHNGTVLTFIDNSDKTLLNVPLSCNEISVSIDGKPLYLFEDRFFIISYSDLSAPTIIVQVESY